MLYVASGDSDHARGIYRTPSSAGVRRGELLIRAGERGSHAYGVLDVAGNAASPSVDLRRYVRAGGHQERGWRQPLAPHQRGGQCPGHGPGSASHESRRSLSGRVHIFLPVTPMVYRTTDGGEVWVPAGNTLPPVARSPRSGYQSRQPDHRLCRTVRGRTVQEHRQRQQRGAHRFAPISVCGGHSPDHTQHALPGRDNALGSPGTPALYKSTNSGSSWVPLTVADDCVSDVMVNPTAPNEVYALGCLGSFLKSANSGGRWTRQSFTQTFGTANYPYNFYGLDLMRLGYDSGADRLYATYGAYGLLVSEDRGATWTRLSGADAPPAALHSLFYQPANGALYVGSSHGVWRRPSSPPTCRPSRRARRRD